MLAGRDPDSIRRRRRGQPSCAHDAPRAPLEERTRGVRYRSADPAWKDFQRTACRTYHRSIRAGWTARDHRTADPDHGSQAAVLRKGRASSRSVCHNYGWTQRLSVSRADGIRRSTRSSEERFRMTVPSYSLIIETANLSLADLDGLRKTLDSLAVQTLPVQNACEVLLADSGDVPPDSLQQTLRTYPWVAADGTGGGHRVRGAQNGRRERLQRRADRIRRWRLPL